MGNARADESVIRLEIDEGVAVVTFNLPEKGNAWSQVISTAYFDTLEQLAIDERVRVVIVTGAGKSFCVGGDSDVLGAIGSGEYNPHASTNRAPYYFPMIMGKPVIAAINGACFGVGLQMALCCDMRFVADDCKISTSYVRRGVIAEMGTSWLLPRLVGRGRAMDLLLSGRVVRADEALAMGLAERVVPGGALLSETIEYAKVLAVKCGPQTMREIKQQINVDGTSDFLGAFERSEAMLQAAYRSADFEEGVSSWRENRVPDFPPLPAQKSLVRLTLKENGSEE